MKKFYNDINTLKSDIVEGIDIFYKDDAKVICSGIEDNKFIIAIEGLDSELELTLDDVKNFYVNEYEFEEGDLVDWYGDTYEVFIADSDEMIKISPVDEDLFSFSGERDSWVYTNELTLISKG
jgi:hypothetical protein